MKKQTIYWVIAIIIVLVIIAIVASPKTETLPSEEVEGVVSEEGALEEGALEEGALEEGEALVEELAGEVVFDTIAEVRVSADGFEPADFYVTTADVVKVSITSDKQPCLLKFEHADLQGVIIDVAADGSAEEIFGRPLVGEYTFYCEGIDPALTGVMHVRYKSGE